MPSFYQPGIPTGTVNLDVDYKNIQSNFQQLDTTFGIDHTTFSDNTSQNGYHTKVHLIPQTVTPAVAGVGQIFDKTVSDGIDTDQILYFLTGKNKLMQLTRNFVPVASSNGFTFIPGGLILQWGQVNSTSHSFQTLTFSTANKAFPNNCFSVWTQPYGSGNVPGSQATVEIRKSTISKTSFEWVFVTNSGEYTGFFWIALGN